MFTRCPSCRAAFSISDQQLEIAAGMVRCGMCEHVFDARLYLFDQPNDNMYETVDVELGEDEASAIDLEFLDRELHGTHPHLPETAKVPLPPLFDTTKQTTPEKVYPETTVPKIIADDITNLENEEANIPTIKLLTSISIFLLLATLAIQIIATSKLSLIPQQYQQQLCQWITCTIEIPRNLYKIEVLNRSIYTHPSEQQALMVTVTIINRAEFAQPYPLIQLRFLNIAGEVIAARQFAANHYLKDKWTPSQLMEKNIPLSIKLEVHDVGEEVVSYDFDFL
ncbi:MAG: DUF3426 domain-containing protein [Gammaproteobacteria bacterium]|nr:DUF3426 domain-containing protein [Gammaproteobacteria bacterium]